MMRKRPAFLLYLLLAAGILPACQGVQAPPPEPPPQQLPRSVVPADLKERYIHQMIYDMRDSFVAGDTAAFTKNVSEGFYGGRGRLEQNLTATLASIYAIQLEVFIEKVEIEDNVVTAMISWGRKAINKESGLQVEHSGKTQLVFHRGEKLSLVKTARDPIFGIAGY